VSILLKLKSHRAQHSDCCSVFAETLYSIVNYRVMIAAMFYSIVNCRAILLYTVYSIVSYRFTDISHCVFVTNTQ
jgi:hypothetical protein